MKCSDRFHYISRSVSRWNKKKIVSICEPNDRAKSVLLGSKSQWWRDDGALENGLLLILKVETIALVIGHGRPMRKRSPPRTFVGFFAPCLVHFSASFLPLPHAYPFAFISCLREMRCSPPSICLSLETYLNKIEIERERRSYFLVIIFSVFASPLREQAPISMIDLSKRS